MFGRHARPVCSPIGWGSLGEGGALRLLSGSCKLGASVIRYGLRCQRSSPCPPLVHAVPKSSWAVLLSVTLAPVPEQLSSPCASGSDTGLEDGLEGVASRRQNREELALGLRELGLRAFIHLVLGFPVRTQRWWGPVALIISGSRDDEPVYRRGSRGPGRGST